MSGFLSPNEAEDEMLEIREFIDDNDVVTGSNVVNLKEELNQTNDIIGNSFGKSTGFDSDSLIYIPTMLHPNSRVHFSFCSLIALTYLLTYLLPRASNNSLTYP